MCTARDRISLTNACLSPMKQYRGRPSGPGDAMALAVTSSTAAGLPPIPITSIITPQAFSKDAVAMGSGPQL